MAGNLDAVSLDTLQDGSAQNSRNLGSSRREKGKKKSSNMNNSKIHVGFGTFIREKVNPVNVYCRVEDLLRYLREKYHVDYLTPERNKEIGQRFARFYDKNIYDGNGGGSVSKIIKALRTPIIICKE